MRSAVACCQGQANAGRASGTPWWNTPSASRWPKREAMVAGALAGSSWAKARAASVATTAATSGAGRCGILSRGHRNTRARAIRPMAVSLGLKLGSAWPTSIRRRPKRSGWSITKPEEILELERGDDHRDAGGEAERDRERDVLDERAHPGEAHPGQDHAGEQGGGEQPTQAVLGRDGMEDDDERGGRAAHRIARSAEQRGQHAGEGRGVEAVLRRHARGDGQRHRQRHRDDADREAGAEVGEQVGAGVAVVQRVPQRGRDGEGVEEAEQPGHGADDTRRAPRNVMCRIPLGKPTRAAAPDARRTGARPCASCCVRPGRGRRWRSGRGRA